MTLKRGLSATLVLAVLGAASVLAATSAPAAIDSASTEAAGDGTGPIVRKPSAFAEVRSLKALPRSLNALPISPVEEEEHEPEFDLPFVEHEREQGGSGGGFPDPVVQDTFGTGTIPSPNVVFDGVPQTTGTVRPIPPDPVGEVGPNHFVQMVNLRYAVFDKRGKLLAGPVETQTLFAPLGDVCGVTNEGDPIVVYDQLADRWLLSQFGFVDVDKGPYYQCIAVSKTGDPTAGYYLYAFKISDAELNDYPKFGVWPDAYYLSVNLFAKPELFFSGVGVVAFERDRMLAGDPNARMVYFDLWQQHPNVFSLLPSDLDGPTPPPAGAPNVFVGLGIDLFTGFKNELQLFRFHVDWSNPGGSTFLGPSVIPTAAYDPNLCNYDNCVPQKGSFQLLDTLSSRLMFRLAYRNFGDHESLVVNHTVDVGDDRAGVRWYEIRNPRGTPFVYQQGTFAPDASHRWMGSIAMDGNGDIALGYSVSGADVYPSVRFTGRLAGDPLGEMTLGEGSLVEGGGAQTHPAGRWGDYSDMTVDPTDDCTFWYTQEYLKSTTERGWSTRIGSFTYPGCDTTDPSVKAFAARATAGKRVALRYSVEDNKGETMERIRILNAKGRVVTRIATGFGPANGSVQSVATRAPNSAGTYRFCVTAIDRKGNESAERCARLRVAA
jgi:hypothetical protein